MHRPALALILLTALLLACSLVGKSPAASTEPGVLFRDDFSDTSSGWDRQTISEGTTDYADGVYRIYVNDTNVDYWANPGESFTDVRVEVEATKVGGPDDNDLGVICRYADKDNFYFGLISSDGYAVIGKVKDGEQTGISSDGLEPVEGINLGEAANLVRMDCVGEALTLFVNGTQIVATTDSDFAKGDVGLYGRHLRYPGHRYPLRQLRRTPTVARRRGWPGLAAETAGRTWMQGGPPIWAARRLLGERN